MILLKRINLNHRNHLLKQKKMLACCLSRSEREKRRVNKLIDKQIEKEKKCLTKEIKLVLFGTGESGKSTFIKQMRILHGSGYSEEDKRKFIPIIYKNIYMIMSSLIKAMELFDIPYENQQNQVLKDNRSVKN